jgi:hypothetical protein
LKLRMKFQKIPLPCVILKKLHGNTKFILSMLLMSDTTRNRCFKSDPTTSWVGFRARFRYPHFNSWLLYHFLFFIWELI